LTAITTMKKKTNGIYKACKEAIKLMVFLTLAVALAVALYQFLKIY